MKDTIFSTASQSALWDPDAIVDLPPEFRHLLSQKRLAHPEKLTKTALIRKFLKEHDVNAIPPDSPPKQPASNAQERNRTADALGGAFFGAFGAGAYAAGAHLGNQEKSQKIALEANEWAKFNAELSKYNADVQRWETWTQWALSHAEWSTFADEYEWSHTQELKRIKQHNEKIDQWIITKEGQAEIRAIIFQEKRIQRQNRANQQLRKKLITANPWATFTAITFALAIALILIMLISHH